MNDETEFIIYMMKNLSSDELRLRVISQFCSSCGKIQPEEGTICQCWNDE